MKKQKSYIRPVIFTVEVLFVIAAVCAGLYFIRLLSVEAPDRDIVRTSDSRISYVAPAEASVINAVFLWNEETKSIDKVMLEILNSRAYALTYMVIPPETTYSMSSELYRRLSSENITVPQTITLSSLYEYYNGNRSFEAGREILQEMIGRPLPYYTVIKSQEFEHIYNEQDITRKKSSDGSLKSYISDCFADVLSNWSVKDRLIYLETYDKLSDSDVSILQAEGSMKNECFDIDLYSLTGTVRDILYLSTR